MQWSSIFRWIYPSYELYLEIVHVYFHILVILSNSLMQSSCLSGIVLVILPLSLLCNLARQALTIQTAADIFQDYLLKPNSNPELTAANGIREMGTAKLILST